MNQHMRNPRTLAERLWAKVNKNGPVPVHKPELGPCWVWTGARGGGKTRSGKGHGLIGLGKAEDGNALVHRVSFMLEHGRWPEPCCLHACDNPVCVRPSHLFEGTLSDNNADMRAKGREGSGSRHGSKTHPESVARGADAGPSKLTEEQVREIRVAFENGENRRGLAERYGIKVRAVYKIASRQTWAHLP